MIKKQDILRVAGEAQEFQNATIEYNGDLPEDKEITADNFYGVKAVHNKMTKKDTCHLIFKY